MTDTHDELTQAEKRQTLLNDARVRAQQQGSTFSQFAESEAAEDRGRFTAHERSTVVGSTPSAACHKARFGRTTQLAWSRR